MEGVKRAKLVDTRAEITVTLTREDESVLSRSSLFPDATPFCGEVAQFGVVRIDAENKLVFDEFSFSGPDKILEVETDREILIASSFCCDMLKCNVPKITCQGTGQIGTIATGSRGTLVSGNLLKVGRLTGRNTFPDKVIFPRNLE